MAPPRLSNKQKAKVIWLVDSTYLKHICQIGSSSRIGVNIKKSLKPPPSYDLGIFESQKMSCRRSRWHPVRHYLHFQAKERSRLWRFSLKLESLPW